MIYVLYGLEAYLKEREIKNILESNHITPINCSEYDLGETNIEVLLNDASTISLFSEKKAIIGDDAYFLTSIIKKNGLEHNLTLLEEYIKNPNPDSIIIFVVNYEKLDERKKLVKEMRKCTTIKELKADGNTKAYAKELFQGYQIDYATLELLYTRTQNNLMLLEQEANKLMLYKYDEKEITKEDVITLTNKNIDTDIFHFIENIVNKKKEDAIEAYYEMILEGEEPIKIIVMLANQFRIIYQAKELYKKGYTEANIASELGIHPYRIKLALEKGRMFSSETLLKYLNELAHIDMQIKSGEVDKNIALELFILGLQ